MSESLRHVPIAFPTPLLPFTLRADQPARSWIQLARTGSFVSNRYGKFSITKEDLSQMVRNFNEITPKAPTELPIDYDHLSMDPKKPGDGIAAGWLKKVELRKDDELWGEVEWTPDGAERIRNQEYRFISPSFVKDHVHKDGKKIGTTLLAAAVTNHPFLEGMKALTLYSFSALGDLAVLQEDIMLGKPQRRAISLAEVGQRVCFIENEEATPELSPRERAMTFVVKAVRGVGDDAFVKVETVDGEPYGWYPVTVFGPARAGEEKNPMTKATDTPKDATDAVMARVKQEANKHGIDLSMRLGDAVKKLAGPGDEALALSYRRQFTDGVVVEEQVTEPAPSVTLSLSATQATSFLNLVNDIKRERGINNEREAIHLAQQLRPDLAEAYAEGQF